MMPSSNFELIPLSSQYEEEYKSLLLEMNKNDLEQMTKFGTFVDEKIAGEIASAKASRDPQRERTFILMDKTNGRIAGYTSQIYFTRQSEGWCRPGGLFVSHAYRGRGVAKILEGNNTEMARQLGRNIQGSMHTDNKGMLRVVRSCGNIVQGLFIDQERWQGKHTDIISVANYTDGSIAQEEATRRYLDAATKAITARDSMKQSPMIDTGSFDIVRLNRDHKGILVSFLLELDKETLRNYARFGDLTRSDVVEEIAVRQVNAEPEDEQGFVIIDKNTGKIAAYGHLEFFAREARSHTTRSGLVISSAYKDIGLDRMMIEHMIERAKEVGLEKIWTGIYWDDTRSFQLACSLGFIVETVFANREKWNGELRNIISMARFISESITQEEATERYLKALQDYYK